MATTPVCAAHQAVDFGNGVENIVDIEPVRFGVFGDFAAQFVREYVEQDFGIGAGVDVAQVFVAHVFIKFGSVGEVAVVRQNDAERRADVKRLRLSAAASVPAVG